MKKVVIVDYGMGNLDSVVRAVEECGGNPVVSGQIRDLDQANHIILPGVGAFAMGIRHIRERGLEELLVKQVLDKGIPFLGICLGMQLLATKGSEGGDVEGLGWVEGTVVPLSPDRPGVRIPHTGWNEVDPEQDSPLFEGIPSGKDFYFTHGYHLICKEETHILARTPYCGRFVSAIGKNHIFGVQFHPEKSQRAGFQLIKNFLAVS